MSSDTEKLVESIDKLRGRVDSIATVAWVMLWITLFKWLAV